MVARADGGHGITHGFCNTGEFMSQNHGRVHFGGALFSVINMDICAADTAGLHTDQHLPGSGLWQRYVSCLKYGCV